MKEGTVHNNGMFCSHKMIHAHISAYNCSVIRQNILLPRNLSRLMETMWYVFLLRVSRNKKMNKESCEFSCSLSKFYRRVLLNFIRIRRLVASTRGTPQFNVSCAKAALPPSNRPHRPTRNRIRLVPNLNRNVSYRQFIVYHNRISDIFY